MEQPVDKETAKNKFRSSRLSWSNQAEHKLRQELSDIAIAKELNACLHQYTNAEQFEIYRQRREKEMLEEDKQAM
ncbi:hypothetical protein PRIC1_013817 [Phytophthora ramorum]